MRKINKGCVVILILVLFSLSACGCKHEWKEATCLTPEICNLCGDTRGEKIEHDYMEANCDNPKRCSYCDAKEGVPLGHDYYNGYCTKCYMKDPDYIDLNNFGFQNMYGMTTWVEITGYKFSEGYVYYTGLYGANYTRVYSFEGSYIKSTWQAGVSNFVSGEIHEESPSVKSYYNIDNDVCQTGWGDWIIFERVTVGDHLVLKTKLDGDETWLVPVGLLDLSKTTTKVFKDKFDEDINGIVFYLK